MTEPQDTGPATGRPEAVAARSDPTAGTTREEWGSLVREMGRAHAEMLRFQVEHYRETVDAADRTVRRTDEQRLESALRTVPSSLSWFNLSTIAEHAPEQAMAAWQRVLDEAREELVSGRRAAK